jgi:hypothetical protein
MWSRLILALSGISIVSSAAEAQSCLRWNSYVSRWDYIYCGAAAANSGAGYVAGRLVPGGQYAYRAGNYVGNYMATHPQPGHVWNPPPIQRYSYTPPQLPYQLRQYAPIYPNYGRRP